tara:strand:- start:230 stop:439 length:210 start_codon:yes stop_codon:yes gene_type:complete
MESENKLHWLVHSLSLFIALSIAQSIYGYFDVEIAPGFTLEYSVALLGKTAIIAVCHYTFLKAFRRFYS